MNKKIVGIFVCIIISISFMALIAVGQIEIKIRDAAINNSSIVLGPKFIPKGPRIDGEIRLDEWSNADSAEFKILDSVGFPGRVMQGTIYVMNDKANLFIGIKIRPESRSWVEPYLGIHIVFDNNHDGQLNRGDNSFFVGFQGDSNDYFYGVDNMINDLDDNGVNNGEAAADVHSIFPTGSEQHFEIIYPLDTYDDNHDFSLSYGDTVGFTLSYTYQNNLLGNYWWPGDIDSPDLWGDIYIASPPELPESGINLRIDRIEITQSIQNPKNEMPMVRYKPTFVRVHIKVDDPTVPGTWPKTVNVHLYGADEDESVGEIKTSLDIRKSSKPDDLSSTANFILPRHWFSRSYLQLSARIELTQEYETNENDNWKELDLIPFYTTYNPTIYFIRPNNASEGDPPDQQTMDYVNANMDWMENVFPIAYINPVELSWELLGAGQLRNFGNTSGVADLLNNLYSDITGVNSGDLYKEKDQIIGFGLEGGGKSFGGVSAVTGPGNTGGYSGMAHEIDHNWGPQPNDEDSCKYPIEGGWGKHVSNDSCCGNKSICPPDPVKTPYGFWWDYWGPNGCNKKSQAKRGDPVWQDLYDDDQIHGHGINVTEFPFDGFIEWTKPELMSYNRTKPNKWEYKWISTYRWPLILSFLKVLNDDNNLFSDEDNLNISDKKLMIRGCVSRENNTGYLNPTFYVNDIRETSTKIGQYEIILLDKDGGQLTTKGFTPNFIDADNNIYKEDFFNIIVPYYENTNRILLKFGDMIIDEIKISLNEPSIEVLSPNGGENWQDKELIEWSAQDSDSDDLTYMIYYSADEGETWKPISPYIKENSYLIDSNYLSGSDNALIRVVASDGLNIVEDISDHTFSVSGKPPTARISCPLDATTWDQDNVVLFRGHGSDIEDDILSDESYQWISDISGLLGVGRIITAHLPPGVHTITLLVIDSDGNQAEDYVTVIVESEETILMDIIDGITRNTIITNNGEELLNDIYWRVDLNGAVFIGASTDGIIAKLAPGESISVGPKFAFGIGNIEIKLKVILYEEEIIHSESGFIIGPFILGVKDY